jgi:hypothetical protein
MWLLTLQLFKNSIDTQEKLRLNLHSLSVSELLEYRPRRKGGRIFVDGNFERKFYTF